MSFDRRYNYGESKTAIWNRMDETAEEGRGQKWGGICQDGYAQHRLWNGKQLVLRKCVSTARRYWTLDGEKITGQHAWDLM